MANKKIIWIIVILFLIIIGGYLIMKNKNADQGAGSGTGGETEGGSSGETEGGVIQDNALMDENEEIDLGNLT